MNKRILIASLGLIALLLTTGAAGKEWSVKLRDGKTQVGQLIRLQAGRYLLQTGGTLLELNEDEIDPSTFTDRSRKDAAPKQPVVETRSYDELHADGTATMHWEMHLKNTSQRAVTELKWGLASWERDAVDRREYRDPFGNELTPRYDPPRAEWSKAADSRVQVILPLAVPVAPGETLTVNCQETSVRSQKTDDGFRYRNMGDYAEDRLVWLKVRLPHDAKVQSITPKPTARFTDDGFEYVMWRRYYKSGQEVPLEIQYELE
jgi:hypothetical protein